MSTDRRKVLLESTLETVRTRLATVTSAHSVVPCPELIRARVALEACASALAQCCLDYDPERTPLPTSASQSFKAVTVTEIFDAARRGEP